MKWLLRGLFATAVIVGFCFLADYEPVALALILITTAGVMLHRSWVIESAPPGVRAETHGPSPTGSSSE